MDCPSCHEEVRELKHTRIETIVVADLMNPYPPGFITAVNRTEEPTVYRHECGAEFIDIGTGILKSKETTG